MLTASDDLLPHLLVSDIRIVIEQRCGQRRPISTLQHLRIHGRQSRPRLRECRGTVVLPKHTCRGVDELHHDRRAIKARAGYLNRAVRWQSDQSLRVEDAGVVNGLLVEVWNRRVHGIPLRLALFQLGDEPSGDADGAGRVSKGQLR